MARSIVGTEMYHIDHLTTVESNKRHDMKPFANALESSKSPTWVIMKFKSI